MKYMATYCNIKYTLCFLCAQKLTELSQSLLLADEMTKTLLSQSSFPLLNLCLHILG